MKSNRPRRKPVSITKTRWVAYAAAGVATALGGSQRIEAAIHYSGRLDAVFPPFEETFKTFPLDEFNTLEFLHETEPGIQSFAGVHFYPPYYASFRGRNRDDFVAKLPFGENISAGVFAPNASLYYYNPMVINGYGQFTQPTRGYIGFRFNTNVGTQYGWVRVKMAGVARNSGFKLLDYAFADPGEPIFAGQTSSDQKPSDQVPDQGSLGWLALGATGLLAWRKSRSRTARLEDA